MPDRPLLTPRTHHRDRARLEDATDGSDDRRPVACVGGSPGLGGGLDIEHHPHDFGIALVLAHESRFGENIQHLVILGQCVRRELAYAVSASLARQVLEQDCPDAVTLVVVIDQERHLGIVSARLAEILGDRDDHVVDLGDEDDDVDPVGVGKPFEFLGRHLGMRAEVAQHEGFGAEA